MERPGEPSGGNSAVSDSFEPFQFLEYARAHVRIAAIIVAAALASSAAVSLALANRYTATAVMLIEPPGGSDPRISTAVSPVYLESLKTYEQFAASDTLFARACEKFHLLGIGSPPIEAFKKQVLEVKKPKETKLLQLSVTLHDPKQAQAVAQFLAEQTVELNRTIAVQTDRENAQRARAEVERLRAERSKAQVDAATGASAGLDVALEGEIKALAEVRSKLDVEIAEAKSEAAEYNARRLETDAAAARAKVAILVAERDTAIRNLTAKQNQLARAKVRSEQADARLSSLDKEYESASDRAGEADAMSGMRAERIRIIDPGIVPQKPSSPNLPLNCAAALCGGAMLASIYLAVGFGLDKQRSRHVRAAFQVARRGSA
jgi:capsular polysaccharide biosynthesis protein